jgi:hypothetical protein
LLRLGGGIASQIVIKLGPRQKRVRGRRIRGTIPEPVWQSSRMLRCRRTNGTSLSANPYWDLSCDYYLAPISTNKLICEALHLGLKKAIFGYMIFRLINRSLMKDHDSRRKLRFNKGLRLSLCHSCRRTDARWQSLRSRTIGHQNMCGHGTQLPWSTSRNAIATAFRYFEI